MSSRKTILIVERDEEMRELIALQVSDFLSADFRKVRSAHEALQILDTEEVHLILADWTLPDLSCSEFLSTVRAKRNASELPILIFAAEGDPETRQKILGLGANEIIVKPFDRSTLQIRVESLIRQESKSELAKLVAGAVTLDTRSFDVYHGAERIHLTPSEYKLLHALMDRQGNILSRDALITLVQGEGICVVDRAVDTHIFSLRKKLGSSSEMIETVRGTGYRVRVP